MNLIICCTPLQVLIAEKIINEHKESNFIGIMMSSENNKKYQYYYNKLNIQVENSDYIHTGKNTSYIDIVKNLFFISSKSKRWRELTFEKIFVASIQATEVQLLISKLNFKKIITFDDGTANISKDSFFYKYEKKSIKSYMLRYFFGIRYDTRTLREMSECHYTIYSNKGNIHKDLRIVDLLGSFDNIERETTQNIKILLTQPIFNEPRLNVELYNALFEEYKFDYYISHPRDNFDELKMKKVESELIFEDFILNEVNNNPCCRYIVYTCFSGAILNVCGIKNVSVVALKPDMEKFNMYQGVYDFFLEKGINIENVYLKDKICC